MTKDRKSPAWFRTHADLAETVNAERRKQGLPLSTVAKKKAAPKKPAFVERKAYRAREVPDDYVTIEQSRAALQQEMGLQPVATPTPMIEEIKQPWHLRD